MTLGFCMQFCSTCERETNHRIRELNGRHTKECAACSHATGAPFRAGAGVFRHLPIPGATPPMFVARPQAPT
jgi:hypothetical protein